MRSVRFLALLLTITATAAAQIGTLQPPTRGSGAYTLKYTLQCSMQEPYDIAVTAGTTGKAFVTDSASDRVYVFNVASFGGSLAGIWPWAFAGDITGIAVDEAKGHVYVIENFGSFWSLDVFDYAGSMLMQVVLPTFAGECRGVAVDASGNVYCADRGTNSVIVWDGSFFVPANYYLSWLRPADRIYTTGFATVIDVSVDCCGHIHVTHDCNCYMVVDSVTGLLWSAGGAGGPHVPPGLFGVDAKLPAYGLGMIQSFVTAQDFVRSFEWDSFGMFTVPWNITTGLVTPHGCETEILGGQKRLFVCSWGNGLIRVYGP